MVQARTAICQWFNICIRSASSALPARWMKQARMDISRHSAIYISIGKDCTTEAMDQASECGHFSVVEYLHSIGKNCTIKAIRSKRFAVVRYICETSSELKNT